MARVQELKVSLMKSSQKQSPSSPCPVLFLQYSLPCQVSDLEDRGKPTGREEPGCGGALGGS